MMVMDILSYKNMHEKFYRRIQMFCDLVEVAKK